MTEGRVSDIEGEVEVRRRLTDVLDSMREETIKGFAEMRVILGGKADRADLDRINQRLDDHQTQLSELRAEQLRRAVADETQIEARAAAHSHLERTWQALAAAGGLGMLVITVLASTHVIG